MQRGSRRDRETDRNRARFDWSMPRFLPVDVRVGRDRIDLAAGGEQVSLAGRLFDVCAGEPLKTRWSIDSTRPFAVLSLELVAGRETVLHSVAWFAGVWEGVEHRLVHRTSLQDNALVGSTHSGWGTLRARTARKSTRT